MINERGEKGSPIITVPPKPSDLINHPSHYTIGDIEVIDAIEDWRLGFHLGNVIKYVARAGKKADTKTITDLKKAQWYLNRAIERLEDGDE